MMGLTDEMKTNKGKYLKKMVGNEMQFQLKDLEAAEEYKVWDDASKQWFRTGQNMTMTATDGTVLAVEETKYIKNDLWTKYFPNHKTARKSTVNRQIITELGEGQYGFPITANKALQAHIDTIKNTGGDPLKVLFLMKKPEGNAKEYTVQVLGIGNITPKPQLSPTMTLKPVGGIQITIPNKQALNEQEKALIEAFKLMKEEDKKGGLQVFAQLYIANKDVLGVIGDERLRELFGMI